MWILLLKSDQHFIHSTDSLPYYFARFIPVQLIQGTWESTLKARFHKASYYKGERGIALLQQSLCEEVPPEARNKQVPILPFGGQSVEPLGLVSHFRPDPDV